ncbi:D-Ala-D-Ala carboxypeptidase family metallohydrolase [Proteiniphilum sp.]|uniref:D-Ala-D-Ala carboxypeptidase family metallohydrolase n=1 Tax=Proteiniphilum sp. TaxID=1926877 RepID=UPI002B218C76|nr:D-Ala-D-Ala carboxypeptidase family metallohydrolase [Proteiniphilum sp.]MEA4918153.1 D-Ala-D-Ala carboxypeptidase family metallohydrolase [Proteiniphilum sp.]
MTRITKNFTLEELSHSNTAKAKNIPNEPGTVEKANLVKLAICLLQPLRNLYGKTMVVNSGYRSPEVNRLVGGVPTSLHMQGKAADISCENPRELQKLLVRSGLPFDQAILYDDGRNNFLHLSFNEGKNRKQVLYSKGTRP